MTIETSSGTGVRLPRQLPNKAIKKLIAVKESQIDLFSNISKAFKFEKSHAIVARFGNMNYATFFRYLTTPGTHTNIAPVESIETLKHSLKELQLDIAALLNQSDEHLVLLTDALEAAKKEQTVKQVEAKQTTRIKRKIKIVQEKILNEDTPTGEIVGDDQFDYVSRYGNGIEPTVVLRNNEIRIHDYTGFTHIIRAKGKADDEIAADAFKKAFDSQYAGRTFKTKIEKVRDCEFKIDLADDGSLKNISATRFKIGQNVLLQEEGDKKVPAVVKAYHEFKPHLIYIRKTGKNARDGANKVVDVRDLTPSRSFGR